MKNFVIFMGIICGLASCNLYPGEDARTEQLDVIITHGNPEVDFSGLSTYAITNKVKPISDDPNNPPSFTLDPAFNDKILDHLKSNMYNYGWVLIDSTQNPDMTIDVGFALTQNTNVYGNNPGYGWGYPGYGWGYSWWSYPTVTSYPVSSIIIAGLDLNNVDTVNQEIPVMWHGVIQGPHIDNVADPDARLYRDLDQAFTQSPYLKLN